MPRTRRPIWRTVAEQRLAELREKLAKRRSPIARQRIAARIAALEAEVERIKPRLVWE